MNDSLSSYTSAVVAAGVTVTSASNSQEISNVNVDSSFNKSCKL